MSLQFNFFEGTSQGKSGNLLEGLRYRPELISSADEDELLRQVRWHRDKGVFGEVVGFSLLAPCMLRFRRKRDGKWDRVNVLAEPRSAYHLSGEARLAWEHSILRVDDLRYSITFRTMRGPVVS